MKSIYIPLLLAISLFSCILKAENKNLLATPAAPSSNLSFSNIQGNSISVAWTKGDGQRRIVIAKAGSAVTAIPSNGTDYNVNITFGNGDEIAPGELD